MQPGSFRMRVTLVNPTRGPQLCSRVSHHTQRTLPLWSLLWQMMSITRSMARMKCRLGCCLRQVPPGCFLVLSSACVLAHVPAFTTTRNRSQVCLHYNKHPCLKIHCTCSAMPVVLRLVSLSPLICGINCQYNVGHAMRYAGCWKHVCACIKHHVQQLMLCLLTAVL